MHVCRLRRAHLSAGGRAGHGGSGHDRRIEIGGRAALPHRHREGQRAAAEKGHQTLRRTGHAAGERRPLGVSVGLRARSGRFLRDEGVCGSHRRRVHHGRVVHPSDVQALVGEVFRARCRGRRRRRRLFEAAFRGHGGGGLLARTGHHRHDRAVRLAAEKERRRVRRHRSGHRWHQRLAHLLAGSGYYAGGVFRSDQPARQPDTGRPLSIRAVPHHLPAQQRRVPPAGGHLRRALRRSISCAGWTAPHPTVCAVRRVSARPPGDVPTRRDAVALPAVYVSPATQQPAAGVQHLAGRVGLLPIAPGARASQRRTADGAAEPDPVHPGATADAGAAGRGQRAAGGDPAAGRVLLRGGVLWRYHRAVAQSRLPPTARVSQPGRAVTGAATRRRALHRTPLSLPAIHRDRSARLAGALSAGQTEPQRHAHHRPCGCAERGCGGRR
eukprot:ctg_1477.g399